MNDDQITQLEEMTNGKLAIVPDSVKGKIIVLVDDSIVRGNTTKALVRALKEAGAREVHVRSSFPPVRHPCHLGVSMRTYRELIAHRLKGNEEAIAKEIGATSVGYLSVEGFLEARGKDLSGQRELSIDLPLDEGLCMGCVTGHCPYDKKGREHDFTIFERKNHTSVL